MEAKSEVDVVISRSQAYLAWPAWSQAAGQAKLQAAQCPGPGRQGRLDWLAQMAQLLLASHCSSHCYSPMIQAKKTESRFGPFGGFLKAPYHLFFAAQHCKSFFLSKIWHFSQPLLFTVQSLNKISFLLTLYCK